MDRPAIQIGVFHLAKETELTQHYETAAWYTKISVPPGDYPIYTRFERAISGTAIPDVVNIAFKGNVIDYDDAPRLAGVPMGGNSKGRFGEEFTITQFERLDTLREMSRSGLVTFHPTVKIGQDDKLVYSSEMERTGKIEIKPRNLLSFRFAEAAYLEEFFEKHKVPNLTIGAFNRGVIEHLVLPKLETPVKYHRYWNGEVDGNPITVESVNGVDVRSMKRADVDIRPEKIEVSEQQMLDLLPTLQYARAAEFAKQNEGNEFSGKMLAPGGGRSDDLVQEIRLGVGRYIPRALFGDNPPKQGQDVTIKFAKGQATWKENERELQAAAAASRSGGMNR